ncbi:glycosyl hydrolases family 18-domain-containing protein [Hyaloraphidium curvatum]|nr:glycosyl hydrolases family 18-domain-containing protein [Hyaloraphidium curvatum]
MDSKAELGGLPPFREADAGDAPRRWFRWTDAVLGTVAGCALLWSAGGLALGGPRGTVMVSSPLPEQQGAGLSTAMNMSTSSEHESLYRRAQPDFGYLSSVFSLYAQDPMGGPSVYDIDTAPGSIMRRPIPYLSGEMPLNFGPLNNTMRLTRTRVSKVTRTRVSKLPFGTTAAPITTTTITAPPTTTTVSDIRCGAVVSNSCPEGLCCSVYGWCGFSDAHCLSGCQPDWGRCNKVPAVPTATQTITIPAPTQTAPTGGVPTPGTIAYFPNWGPSITNYDIAGVNVINYAFVTMRADGSLSWGGDYASGGMMYQLNSVYKARYPGLRTVFSIGGWTDSQWFSLVGSDAGRRNRFADSIYQFTLNNQFDGVDLDWEYPSGGGQPGNTQSPDDARNFVLMVQEIRNRLGPNRLITIAASTDLGKYGNYLLPLANLLDWINIMSYDMAGPWSGSAGYNAPLFREPGTGDSQSDAINRFAAAGVPRAKLTMGMAFYGRGFRVASGANNGLYQRQIGAPTGDGTDDPGVWTWRGLRSSILANGPFSTTGDWRRIYRDQVQTPTLFSPSRNVFIGYDDPQSTCVKALWAKNNGFGGVMVWDMSMDRDRELTQPMTDVWMGRRTSC